MDDLGGPRGPLPPRGGRGTSGGMDPWRQTVETRLGDLRDDLRALTVEVRALNFEFGVVKVDVSTIKERIAHLPTKGFIVSALLSTLAVIAAMTAFAPTIQHFVTSR